MISKANISIYYIINIEFISRIVCSYFTLLHGVTALEDPWWFCPTLSFLSLVFPTAHVYSSQVRLHLLQPFSPLSFDILLPCCVYICHFIDLLSFISSIQLLRFSFSKLSPDLCTVLSILHSLSESPLFCTRPPTTFRITGFNITSYISVSSCKKLDLNSPCMI